MKATSAASHTGFGLDETHDALDALSTAIKIRKVNWILDADIQNFLGC